MTSQKKEDSTSLHILIKHKQLCAFLPLWCTNFRKISSSFINSSRHSCVFSRRNLTLTLNFIVQRVVTYCKRLIQFMRDTKTQRCQVRAICYVIHEGDSKVSDLCMSSDLCWAEHCHVEGDAAECEEESQKPCFHLSRCFTVLFKFNDRSFECMPHLTFLKTVITTLPAHAEVLNFLGAGDSFWVINSLFCSESWSDITTRRFSLISSSAKFQGASSVSVCGLLFLFFYHEHVQP
jgi:hypothetical protein